MIAVQLQLNVSLASLVQSKKFDRSIATNGDGFGMRFKMKSSKTKILAAAVAAALLTTLAVARTVHTPVTSDAQQTHETHGKVTGTTPQPNAGSHLHGLLTCGDEMSEIDCMKLQSLLPM
jgi:hypothetical protein